MCCSELRLDTWAGGHSERTLNATCTRHGSTMLLRATGEVDAGNVADWRRLLDGAATATERPGLLIVDTGALEFMAVCAFAALADESVRCRERGIRLCLVSGQHITGRVLVATRLEDQLPLYRDVTTALDACHPSRPPMLCTHLAGHGEISDDTPSTPGELDPPGSAGDTTALDEPATG